MCSVRPVRRSTPFGLVTLRTSSRPVSRGSAPHALSFSFRDVSLQPRNAASSIGSEEPTGSTVPRCSLSWALVPYDTYRNGRPA
jgi:hypothetical protein